jgi:hypothetical protein
LCKYPLHWRQHRNPLCLHILENLSSFDLQALQVLSAVLETLQSICASLKVAYQVVQLAQH